MNKKKIKQEINEFQETYRINEYKNLSFTIILVQPENAGNIGSIARVMENFNFENLIIFNPIEKVGKILSYKTQGFAMHGKNILFNAKIIELKDQNNHLTEYKNLLETFDYVIATTARGKSYSNIKRLAIFPEDLTLPMSVKSLRIAILFGKESRGLTNEEISLADILLRIPTSNKYSALNLSHACGIILYEIFKKINILTIGRGENPVLLAEKNDRLILYNIVKKIIEKLKIRPYKEENVFFAFKNIFGRSLMSTKELSLILGLFSKVNTILESLNPYENKI
ncbi:MAG: TrmJ/YjtD family RNA methyltransferase [Candidatus Lokiarchaeota archaeon]|nr:TrmJ/YjtD family RNA methyltransferase [Candidatus Lokiarchaeota archaeon]